jgi:hypothetical protein
MIAPKMPITRSNRISAKDTFGPSCSIIVFSPIVLMGPLLHGPWSLRRGRPFIGGVTKITLIAAVGCLTSDLDLGFERRDQAASDGVADEAASIEWISPKDRGTPEL